MNLENLYQEIILDHYRHPRSKGLREPFDAEVHHVNPTCGDEISLRVDVEDGLVKDISYDATGCSISQASASVMYEQLVGKPLDQGWPVLDEFVHMIEGRGKVEPDEDVLGDGIAFAGVAAYPARVKCALLGWMAFKDATLQALGKDFT
ncbi:MAG: SUF system NifU family Fe-S cluster assembly protein [Actinobacteria bacterium]|nr:SUF system NifU family Fe-S cluster assembly protein [Actinomycetota bacterium]MCB8996005.1 SUF system NifU family Fe-S cluster assembly protein [Actinomycetota bacterium]MCB9424104.1 SUF system NifU family Fe-S cluster assembly protein [Actinomycetota bacterium]HRY11444.1 SUF system NifU family Fe-S cluster assembly protein [Candidatus Nanopelagicales bacterium]